MKSEAIKNEDEPPSCLRPPIFLLGQDSCGNWVAQDRAGTRGGLFVDRANALRYIQLESGHRAFVAVTAPIELNMARPASRDDRAFYARRVA